MPTNPNHLSTAIGSAMHFVSPILGSVQKETDMSSTNRELDPEDARDKAFAIVEKRAK